MNYLDKNLETVNEYLLRTNFDKILHSIWIEVLEEIDSVVSIEVCTFADFILISYSLILDHFSLFYLKTFKNHLSFIIIFSFSEMFSF